MAWWGKVLGSGFGFLLGGPIGALIGAVIGHQVDQGSMDLESDEEWQPGAKARVQTAFFTATFSVMGHLAKADGVVSAKEIAHAKRVMQGMSLDEKQTRVAMELFARGKASNFNFAQILHQLRTEVGPRRHLLQMFLEIQIDAAVSDGELHPRELQLLRNMAMLLGFAPAIVEQLLDLVRGEAVFHKQSDQRSHSQQHKQNDYYDQRDYQHESKQYSHSEKLAAAYRILGIAETADEAELKRAYRRLMAQHHPDKLVSQGLPEEMMQAATRRVQEIQEAYECIKAHRSSLH